MKWTAATLLLILFNIPAFAASTPEKSRGQTLYVPVYSHVLIGNRAQTFAMATTLSLRNTSTDQSITFVQADYYDNDGKLVKHYLDKPRKLNPLGSLDLFVQEKDKSGGLGANFIVRWTADTPISPPVVEAVMIGAASGQGISLVRSGQVIDQ